MLQFTLIGLADAYPAADGRNQFYQPNYQYGGRVKNSAYYGSDDYKFDDYKGDPFNGAASNYPLGHSEIAFTDTTQARPKGHRTGGLAGCPPGGYVCPGSGITLQRDPNLNCEFDLALCHSVAPPLPDGRMQRVQPDPSNNDSGDNDEITWGNDGYDYSVARPDGRMQKVQPPLPDGRMQKQSDPSTVHARGHKPSRCDTERNKAIQCLLKATELGHGTWDEEWPFFSNELESHQDQELYIRGCYVYTTGRLQGKAFYGGESAKAPTNRVDMIDFECSEPADRPVKGGSANKKTRAKSGSVTVGSAAPTLDAQPFHGHKGGKGVNPAWIIIPSVFGAFLIVVAGLCLRKKGCLSVCARGKTGYDAPEDAEKTDAQMDSVESQPQDAELGKLDSEDAPVVKSRFFCCSRGKKTDAQPEIVEEEASAEIPESPNAYSNILKEAFSKAAADEYTPRRSSILSEGENRVVLSVSSPANSVRSEVEEQKQNGDVEA